MEIDGRDKGRVEDDREDREKVLDALLATDEGEMGEAGEGDDEGERGPPWATRAESRASRPPPLGKRARGEGEREVEPTRCFLAATSF